MNDKKKMYVIVGVALVIAPVWSFLFMADKQTAASNAKEDLQRCKEISSKLDKLKIKPKLASDHEKNSLETTGLIERAARAGQIPAVQRITPQQPKKISDTSYKEKPTDVVLRDITLRQLVEMAKNLSSSEDNLIIKDITLAAPNRKDTGDKWNVELVLSYLIYDPQPEKK